MSNGPMVERPTGASNRHRPSDVDGEPGAPGDTEGAANGRRAFVALAVALVGTVAFAYGLRTALVKLPPERAATAAPTRDTTSPRRFTPPAPSQPDEYPRLR